MMQSMGFQALASTSAGFAWSTGRPDYAVGPDDVVAHLTELCAAVDLPVNADFESGFAAEPSGVAANVGRAITAGVAGLSIEDRRIDDPGKLYDLPIALERLAAAKAAIRQSGHDVLLVARTEGLLLDPANVAQAIDRLVAFAEAGADCLYAPGIRKQADIAAMIRAVAPRPVNVLVFGPELSMAELAELGVRRISVGGSLGRSAWGGFMKAAKEMAEKGTFTELASGYPGGELNKMFG